MRKIHRKRLRWSLFFNINTGFELFTQEQIFKTSINFRAAKSYYLGFSGITLCFFYKNTLYKNIEAQIVPKNKNKLTSWSSDQALLKIRTHQVDIRMH